MSLLDDLKKQADLQKGQEGDSAEQKKRHFDAVQAALKLVSRYLSELAKSLNVIKPPVRRSFAVEQTIKLDNLFAVEYSAMDRRQTIEHKDHLRDVFIRFRWISEQPATIMAEKRSPPTIQRLREDLQSYGLRFNLNEVKNDRHIVERGVFAIQNEIGAAVTATGDWETGKIRLRLKNIERLGNFDFHYDADELDNALLEELAKTSAKYANHTASAICHKTRGRENRRVSGDQEGSPVRFKVAV
jgi:hypothetical protein